MNLFTTRPILRRSLLHHPKEAGDAYALIRIVYALNSLAFFAHLSPLLSVGYGAEAICRNPETQYGFWNLKGQFSFFYHFTSTAAVETFWALGILNSLLLLFGVCIRPCAIFQYLLVSSFFLTPCKFGNYGDQVFAGTSFLLMCMPSRQPWSLRPPEIGTRYSPWLRRTLTAYLSILYLSCMLPRWKSIPWSDGSAVWISLADPLESHLWHFLAADPLLVPLPVFAVLTYSSLLYEGLCPLLIWSRRWVGLVVVAGLSFHLTMGLIMNIGLFSFHMALLLLASLPADTAAYILRAFTLRSLRAAAI